MKQARAQYYPTVTTNPAITAERFPVSTFGSAGSGGTSVAGGFAGMFTILSLPFDASWQPDFWGRVQNNVKANEYGAQASGGGFIERAADDRRPRWPWITFRFVGRTRKKRSSTRR